MKKYIIIKPGNFKAPPVRRYGQRKNTHYKVKLSEHIIAEVKEEYGPDHGGLVRVYPDENVPTWIRSGRTDGRRIEFFVNPGEFLDDERTQFVVESNKLIHEKRYETFLFDVDDNPQEITLYGVDIMKTYETGEIWVDDERGVKYSDVRPVESDKIKLLLMAKEVAKKIEGTITNDDEREFIEEESDYLTIRAQKVDLRNLVRHQIFTTDIEKLKEDLMEVIKKHDPRSVSNEIFRDDVVIKEDSYDATQITLMFESLGLDKVELFDQKRGVITGKKYGL
jgi:hypothetical protein